MDNGSEMKTVFRLSLGPNGTLVERYTDELATTLAKDVFSIDSSIDCLVTVRIELYVSPNNVPFNQPFVRELAELDNLNILCSSRARFPIGSSYFSGNGKY